MKAPAIPPAASQQNPRPVGPPKPSANPDEVYRRYLEGLLSGNRAQCRASFEQWRESNASLRALYEDLMQRALYDVGELWEQGKISVATEHLATAISEGLLNLVTPELFAAPRVDQSAVITSTANEHHQIGGRMVADLFAAQGWRSHFLGASTPLAGVLALIAEKKPDVVALSVALALNLPAAVTAALAIHAACPGRPILVGGQALRWGGAEQLEQLPGVQCLSGLGELESWIETATSHG